MRDISEFTDIELLRELFMRNKVGQAPVKSSREGEWSSSIVAIGKDNSAEIVLTDEAYDLVMLE